MKNRTSKDDRGWIVYPRSDRPGFILKYRVAPNEWRQHRIPPEVGTKRHAERYAATWVEEFRRAPNASPDVGTDTSSLPVITVRDITERWQLLRQANPDLAPSTRAGDKSILDTHILPVFGDRPVEALTSGVLRPFLRDLRAKRAAFTVRNIANTFTQLLEDAIAEEWVALPANPMRHPGVRKEIPEGVPTTGRNTIIYIEREHAAALVTCADVEFDWRARYLLAFESGLRSGEICGLSVCDVDLDAPVPTVDIRKSLAEKGPRGYATLGRTKTLDGVRKLPLHPDVVEVLRAWINDGWKVLVGRAPKSTDMLFPKPSGAPYRPACARMIRLDLEAAGCPTTFMGHAIDFHATRRSFTTWLAAAGVPEGTIKRLMGHAGAGVTQRHYTAHALGPLRDAVCKIQLGITPAQVISPPRK